MELHRVNCPNGISSYIRNLGNICTLLDINIESMPSKEELKKKIWDLYTKFFFTSVKMKPKLQLYARIKRVYRLERYLLGKLSCQEKRSLTKCRISAHNFPIEYGRRLNIDRENRLCTLCNKGAVGNEYHYVIECNHDRIVEYRSVMLSKIKNINNNITLLPEREREICIFNWCL